MHALLAKLNMMAYKRDFLAGYGVESTRELDEYELQEIIDRLRKHDMANRRKNEDTVRSLRSVVLTILQRMGIYQDNGSWSRVNKYLSDSRIAGKLLYKMNEHELRALIKKLRSIERKHMDQKKIVDKMVKEN